MNGCICESYVRVTEAAALAGARWLGRANQPEAEQAAFAAAAAAIAALPISGRVVIGAEDGESLAVGSTVGAGGEEVDVAVDPMEGGAVVARGGNNVIAMIAAGPPGSMPILPDMYMRKLAVGAVARGRISLAQPIGDNVRAVAEALGRQSNDVTALVLDRPRHHDLIEELR